MDKILKFCGFKIEPKIWKSGRVSTIQKIITEPNGFSYSIHDGFGGDYPILDMNFFFKYVVPKLNEKGYDISLEQEFRTWLCTLIWNTPSYEPEYIVNDKDPNKAWQEALLKLIEEAKDE